MPKVLVFPNENGPDCDATFLITADEDMDRATLIYLEFIGDFGWDDRTEKLQQDVEDGLHENMYKRLKNMINEGYDCFKLAEDSNIELKELDEVK